MERLEVIAPGFAKRLDSLKASTLRRLALAACEFAVKQAKVDCTLAYSALNMLRETGALSDEIRDSLDTAAASFDEQYFPIYQSDADDKPAYQPYFDKARALSALSLAGLSDAREAASESIYEASQLLDQRDHLLETLSEMLN